MKFATLALAALSAIPAVFSQGVFIVSPEENQKIASGADLNLTIGHYNYVQNMEYTALSVVLIDPARPTAPYYLGSAALGKDDLRLNSDAGGMGQGWNVKIPIPPTAPAGNRVANITVYALVGAQLMEWPQYANVSVNVSPASEANNGGNMGTSTRDGSGDSSDSDSAAPATITLNSINAYTLVGSLIPALAGSLLLI